MDKNKQDKHTDIVIPRIMSRETRRLWVEGLFVTGVGIGMSDCESRGSESDALPRDRSSSSCSSNPLPATTSSGSCLSFSDILYQSRHTVKIDGPQANSHAMLNFPCRLANNFDFKIKEQIFITECHKIHFQSGITVEYHLWDCVMFEPMITVKLETLQCTHKSTQHRF